MGKKLSSLSDLGGFVFSTNKDFDPSDTDEIATMDNSKQYLEAHFSNKGRGGKTVTIIKGFKGSEDNLKTLGKKLKSKCGVGGSVKDGEIIIQGDFRDKIMDLLKDDQFNVKRVGG